MAQTQVTHDGISKEEKEQIIENYLKEHGLYIFDAPKVQHQEANIIPDDVYYPLRTNVSNEDSNETNSGTGIPDINVFDEYEDIPNFGEMHLSYNYTLVNTNPELKSLIPGTIPPFTGLCISATKNQMYTFDIIRKDGIFRVTLCTGDVKSFATFDGGHFNIYKGKVLGFTEAPDIRGINRLHNTSPGLYIVIDSSKPFESKKHVIPVCQLIDIQEHDYKYDFSIYGVDIKKIYTDWVEELKLISKSTTESTVIVPSGNIKETAPIPPVNFNDTDIEIVEKILTLFDDYSFIDLNGQTVYLEKDTEIEGCSMFIGNAIYYGIIRDSVFYNLPVRIISMTRVPLIRPK